MLRVHFVELWYIWIVNRVLSRYRRNNSTDHIIEKQSCCVESYLRSTSANHLYQYPTGFTVLSGCCCGSTNSVWALHASVSSVLWPLLLGNARTGDDINTLFRELIDFSSSLLIDPKIAGWSFFNIWLSEAARRAKLGTNLLETLQIPKKDRSSLRFVVLSIGV